MPLPQGWGLRDFGVPEKRDTLANAVLIEIPLFHELGSDLSSMLAEATRVIPPSKRTVVVKVQSQVVTQGARGGQSPAYSATVRRRKCRELSKSLAGLAAHAGRDDFAVCTHPLVRQIQELLVTLASADGEGNTREVLRQVRNTLMNGGWNKYREPVVRQTVARVLSTLAEAEEILPSQVDAFSEQLYIADLDPVGSLALAADEEDDGKDEVPG
jgi:hypothetical protein